MHHHVQKLRLPREGVTDRFKRHRLLRRTCVADSLHQSSVRSCRVKSRRILASVTAPTIAPALPSSFSRSPINRTAFPGSLAHCCVKTSLWYLLSGVGGGSNGVSPRSWSTLSTRNIPCNVHPYMNSCRTSFRTLLVSIPIPKEGKIFKSTRCRACVIHICGVSGRNIDVASVERSGGILLIKKDLRANRVWLDSLRSTALERTSKAATVRSIAKVPISGC